LNGCDSDELLVHECDKITSNVMLSSTEGKKKLKHFKCFWHFIKFTL